MDMNKFWAYTNKIKGYAGYSFQEKRPRIVCKDGVSLSVQASSSHYCSPRENGMRSYEEVEVGYPSIRPPEEWRQYFDGEWQDSGFFGTVKQVYEGLKNFRWAYKNISFNYAKQRLLSSFKDNATDSVYGYIPIELVESFIDSHGGIDESKTFAKSE